MIGIDGRGWLRVLAILVVIGASLAASFGVTRIGRQVVLSRQWKADSSLRADSLIPASGSYLVAYVMLSSGCAACRDERTKLVLRNLGDSLRSSHASAFARVLVIGVVIDRSFESGVEYLQDIGPAFDEVSIGGGWLNQQVTNLVWRDALVRAAVPQVVLVERRVDASRYPHDMLVAGDSLVLSVAGRDSLTLWINGGTPLALRQLAGPKFDARRRGLRAAQGPSSRP